MTDVIDRLAAVEPGGRIDALRRHRPVTRQEAQASHDALFVDVDEVHASSLERAAVAVFVTALHDDLTAAAHYAGFGESTPGGAAVVQRVLAEAEQARTTGPYGAYPDGPLAVESTDGPRFEGSADLRAAIGDRLVGALEHAHLLVLRPRESSPEALERLAAAGWSTDGIVTLSQLVAFLAFQVRVVAGLRLLSEEEAA